MTDERPPRSDDPGTDDPGTDPVPEAGARAPDAAVRPAPIDPARRPSADAPPPAPDREFDVPYDTGALHGLPTGQLLAVGRPVPEPLETEYEDEEEQRRVYSQVGAVVGSIGAIASLFVGWMFPLSVAAIVFGVLGLRREEHGRILAFIAIGTGVAGLVFSGVWLGYYAIVFGALPTA
ncbi:hypothetical protein GCM10017608_12900 [Agromyces luteolus]|uniref:DUF4190 domain-containing protein n=1 Tax=Agromyces luteolus TaxID=88373 RepID=A0A7C9HI48_9MICO|nr:DUF4190 domain-containing protein [Agromyces luteolus]MUN07588.1 hypothetical protein [Agromyces luteolus]GLK27356.1 hypothetical protein GCM10017608_12900 [Agromyces luteolus]